MIKKIINKLNILFQARLMPFLVGKDVPAVCPCCNWRGKKFLSARNRNNAVCPKCGSLERHRLYYLFLKDVLPIERKFKVLHFAPEKIITQLFKSYSFCDYLSVDINPKAAMLKADITDLPFRDNLFDVILCSHVLEHIPEDILAMKQLYRVLSPEGFAIIQVPIKDEFNGRKIDKTFEDFSVTSPEERQKLFGQSDHVRIYGRDYSQRLESAGFRLEIKKFIDGLTKEDVRKFGLLPEDSSDTEAEGWIYYCTK